MPIQISQTTQQQIGNAKQQLNQIRQELNRLSDSGSIDRAQFNFLDHLLSANSLLALGIENLLKDINQARP